MKKQRKSMSSSLASTLPLYPHVESSKPYFLLFLYNCFKLLLLKCIRGSWPMHTWGLCGSWCVFRIDMVTPPRKTLMWLAQRVPREHFLIALYIYRERCKKSMEMQHKIYPRWQRFKIGRKLRRVFRRLCLLLFY